MRVLDIGCGTGSLLDCLPTVDYLGFDLNPDYIEAAKSRYGARGRFLCADVNTAPVEAAGSFDRILALFLLHHLEDAEVVALTSLAGRLLAPEGRFVTIDPCYRESQSAAARFLIRRDRGQNVRTDLAYLKLARTTFSEVEIEVREDLLRIPYTHAILRCGLSPASSRSGTTGCS